MDIRDQLLAALMIMSAACALVGVFLWFAVGSPWGALMGLTGLGYSLYVLLWVRKP